MGLRRAVVVPFGVPDGAAGIGVGLAALLHAHGTAFGLPIGLAEIWKRDERKPVPSAPSSLEGFLAPLTWKRAVADGMAPAEIDVVVTGMVEPPDDGIGRLELVAFAATTGDYAARVQVSLDREPVGTILVDALRVLVTSLGGSLFGLEPLAAVSWTELSSLLLAEKSALRDPANPSLPRDRFAALAHFERALGEDGANGFASTRLAHFGEEAAANQAADTPWLAAVVRSMARARAESSDPAALCDAEAAVRIRLGELEEAEACLLASRSTSPPRAVNAARLSATRRLRGDLEGAWSAVEGSAAAHDARLSTERGLVAELRGDRAAAEASWRAAIDASLLDPLPFHRLADRALGASDAIMGSALVDRALSAIGRERVHPSILGRAIELAARLEGPGVARGARRRALSRGLLELVPTDSLAALALAGAHAELGEKGAAIALLEGVEQRARGTALEAEVQLRRFELQHPRVLHEVEAAVRSAKAEPDRGATDRVLARLLRLAEDHGVYRVFEAMGELEERRKNYRAAANAFEDSAKRAPGAIGSRRGAMRAFAALADTDAALRHGEALLALEGATEDDFRAFLGIAPTDRRAAALARARARFPGTSFLESIENAGATASLGVLGRIKSFFAR